MPRVGPCPRACVSLLGVYTFLCPVFENLDAELSGKRIIHIAKELRCPHFFEGCVLRDCVCVCVRACVCVGNFPLELNNAGLENKYGQAVSILQVLGIGPAPWDSQFLAASVLFTRNSGWRVQCVFFFFCNYYFVENFTLALTDLAEAA